MHRRLLLRTLAVGGLGLSVGACAPRRTHRGDPQTSAGDPVESGPGDDTRSDPAEPGPGDDTQTEPPDPGEDTQSDPAEPGPGEDTRSDPAESEPGEDTQADAAEPEPAESGDPPPEPVEVLCREAIDLRPATATDARHRIDRLTLHHTAVALDAAAQAPARLRRHQRYHQNQGWSDIAYHYAVDLAGNVYELRDPAVPGDTFTDYDTTGHLHVVCEGDFEAQRPTDALLDGLAALFAALAVTHGLSPRSLDTHRSYAPTTTCPGQHLRSRLEGLRSRVTDLARDPAPQLALSCGDEARRRVAAIEAGAS